MDVGAGFCMNDVVVIKFTFAISSPDEFLFDWGNTALTGIYKNRPCAAAMPPYVKLL